MSDLSVLRSNRDRLINQISRLTGKVTRLKHSQSRRASKLREQLKDLRSCLNDVEKQMNNLSGTYPTVTEHALFRYIQRVSGIDLEQLKSQILTPALVSLIDRLGDGRYPLEHGGTAVVKGGRIITVLAP